MDGFISLKMARKHKHKHSPLPWSVLIVYSSFSRGLSWVTDMSEMFFFRIFCCHRELLWWRKEMNKHLQPRKIAISEEHSKNITCSGAFLFLSFLTSRWREARWWSLRDRDWQSTKTFFLLLMSPFLISLRVVATGIHAPPLRFVFS